MTDDRTNLEIIDDRTNYLLEIIKKLEERIIKLEAENDLQLRWMARKDNVAGEEYWEHG